MSATYFTVRVPAEVTTTARDIAEQAVLIAEASGHSPVMALHIEDRIHPEVPVEGFVNFPGRKADYIRAGVRVA